MLSRPKGPGETPATGAGPESMPAGSPRPGPSPLAPVLQAPRANRGILAVPPLAEVGGMIAANRERLAVWSERRKPAIAEIVDAALRYLADWGIPVPARTASGLIIAGHQPELFHTGVWIKNFALYRLAARHGLVPLSLIVDNDLARSSFVRVPVTLADGSARRQAVPFDRWTGPVPYEEWHVRDEQVFHEFPAAVQAALGNCGWQPMLPQFWREAERLAARTPLAGERLALARRCWEARWDCHNLELPLSRLAATAAFRGFAAGLIQEAPRLLAVYNSALLAYRQRHGISSRNHPVPELARQGDWHEVPLWVWRTGDNMRGRLYVRHSGAAVELGAGETAISEMPKSVEAVTAGLAELQREGWKIRPRALTNTLFARLYLADLFLHGIGGALYDELTDEIIRGFYGIAPPGFMVLSGTLRLPQPAWSAGPSPCEFQVRLRHLWHHPEDHLSNGTAGNDAIRALCRRKKELIVERPITAAGKYERFHAIVDLNERLRPFVRTEYEALQSEWDQTQKRRLAQKVWQDREYPFCLYPEEELRAWYKEL